MKFIVVVVASLFICTPANADPEKAYQAGKAASDELTGANSRDIDDRDWEQKTRDALVEKGQADGQKKKELPSRSEENSAIDVPPPR